MKKEIDLDKIDICKLIADRELFHEVVYTPLSDVKNILQKRWEDIRLKEVINQFLEGDIPKPLINSYKAILFRQLFSPNHEFSRFMSLITQIGLEPMFLEYYDDKFTSINPIKHCLGKIKFQQTIDQNSTGRIKTKTIINFNESQGRMFKEIPTIWGQSLINFHHELLVSVLPNAGQFLFDASAWFHKQGGRASNYYLKYISLFIRNSACFENFVLEGDELKFIKEIFLPSYFAIWKLTGQKPIFVELLPTSTQSEKYWMSYPVQMGECIKKKMVV